MPARHGSGRSTIIEREHLLACYMHSTGQLMLPGFDSRAVTQDLRGQGMELEASATHGPLYGMSWRSQLDLASVMSSPGGSAHIDTAKLSY